MSIILASYCLTTLVTAAKLKQSYLNIEFGEKDAFAKIVNNEKTSIAKKEECLKRLRILKKFDIAIYKNFILIIMIIAHLRQFNINYTFSQNCFSLKFLF